MVCLGDKFVVEVDRIVRSEAKTYYFMKDLGTAIFDEESIKKLEKISDVEEYRPKVGDTVQAWSRHMTDRYFVGTYLGRVESRYLVYVPNPDRSDAFDFDKNLRLFDFVARPTSSK